MHQCRVAGFDTPGHEVCERACGACANQQADQAAHESAHQDNPGDVLVCQHRDGSVRQAVQDIARIQKQQSRDCTNQQGLDRPVGDDCQAQDDQRRYDG